MITEHDPRIFSITHTHIVIHDAKCRPLVACERKEDGSADFDNCVPMPPDVNVRYLYRYWLYDQESAIFDKKSLRNVENLIANIPILRGEIHARTGGKR